MPLDAGPLSGIDALLATVQMPGGIPVGTVAVGKAGAKNAAYLAAQILALQDAELAETIVSEREQMTRTVLEKECGIAGATGRLMNPGVRVKFLMRGSGWNKDVHEILL